MAIPIGTNALKVYRRHTLHCTRYPGVKNKPDTYRPNLKRDEKADTCGCPIWARGYLAKEIELRNGKQRAKRVYASLDTNDWTEAEKQVVILCERGSWPVAAGAGKSAMPIDTTAITVQYATQRFLTARKDGLAPVCDHTFNNYHSLLCDRLQPFCDEHGILYVRDFANQDVCAQFTESWRKCRRQVGASLGSATAKTLLTRFRIFLSYCVKNEWLRKSGATDIKTQKVTKTRFGLELAEFKQLMDTPCSSSLSELANQETKVACEVMRWSGLRISDVFKFNDSEIVRDDRGIGWNAQFLQHKTRRQGLPPCISPLPDHVVELLRALPGRMEGGRKYYFRTTRSAAALGERVAELAARAQRTKPFAHPFCPHALRHTFAILHLNEGTPIETISKWLGHQSVSTTIDHYSNWIKSTHALAEATSRTANASMMAKVAALA